VLSMNRPRKILVRWRSKDEAWGEAQRALKRGKK
jgi:hypothetical protein